MENTNVPSSKNLLHHFPHQVEYTLRSHQVSAITIIIHCKTIYNFCLHYSLYCVVFLWGFHKIIHLWLEVDSEQKEK